MLATLFKSLASLCLLSLTITYFNPMIELKDYFMGREKTYPEELTHEKIATADVLLKHVNDMLEQLGYRQHVKVISGWRPESINKKIKKAAKKSSHITCEGIDITYVKELAELLQNTPDILEEFNLYMEDIRDSKDHIHLQIRPTKNRVFRA